MADQVAGKAKHLALGACKLWDRKENKKKMKKWIMTEQQKEWDESEEGRRVYEVCKQVGTDRLS